MIVKINILSASLMLLIAGTVQAAELKLAAVFSDHMVLQRDKQVAVWGWADAGAEVTVEFAPSAGSGRAGQKKSARAGVDGKWMMKFDPMPACAEPLTMEVSSSIGNLKSKIGDILVGEVWLGSGQSNMAMGVARARDFETEKTTAHWPLIRMFREESSGSKIPQLDCKGKWVACSPETVGSFSATLYFFGRELYRELKVPVGLINSSVGGTPIESWASAEAQDRVPELNAVTKEETEFDPVAAKATYEKALSRWKTAVAKAKADGKPAPRKPKDPVEQHNRKGGMGGLFNGKIAPLIPYTIRGAVWYQGEANSRPGKGSLYQYQLPALISDWRSRWGEDFAFAWVQLPNFKREGEGWMLVREAMLKTLRLPQTGMVITVDIGDSGNIHPENKQEVGRRLSLWALGTVYGQKVAAISGPLPTGNEFRSSDVVISFTHASDGLVAKDGALKGFVIAGEDRQWKTAQARIDGNKVIISCPDIKKPVAVRYAWEADPVCNLFNRAGLPASPFRTDDWPVLSELNEK